MTVLAILLAALTLAQLWFGVRARRVAARLMRPPEEWEDEDLDRWLALIEPFPLPEPDRSRGR